MAIRISTATKTLFICRKFINPQKLNKMSSLRLFIGIELPTDVKAAIATYVDRMKKEFPDLRVGWESEDKLHITIKFLGSVDEGRIAAIQRILDGAAAERPQIKACIHGTGSFGSMRAPRVLWLKMDEGAREISILASSVEVLLTPLGFVPESRAYTPHVSIARLKDPHQSRQLVAEHLQHHVGPLEFRIDGLSLFQSELTRAGSLYTVLSRHLLRHDPI
jgi:RNA 2',3'-cyclic 3'-phosphodiesterase